MQKRHIPETTNHVQHITFLGQNTQHTNIENLPEILRKPIRTTKIFSKNMVSSLEAIAEYETYIKDTAMGKRNIDYEDVKKQFDKAQKILEKELIEETREWHKITLSKIKPENSKKEQMLVRV